MFLRSSLIALALSLPLLVVGCSGSDPQEFTPGSSMRPDGGTTGSVAKTSGTSDAGAAGFQVGAQFETTTDLNFREGPSTDDTIIRVLAAGTVVTILDRDPVNGFYNVQQGSDTGYVYGSYLEAGATKLPTTAPIGIGDGSGSNGDDDASGLTGTGEIETCKASYYASGSKTASGEPFDANALTAAHKTLPFDTMVKVTNKANGESVNVRINDRGPFVTSRCIDLSRGAFESIASLSAGVLTVTVETLK